MLMLLSLLSFLYAPALINAEEGLPTTPALADPVLAEYDAGYSSVSSPPLAIAARPTRIRTQDVRPLPGQLDSVPVFNSNSPEVVQQDGILLSTFPPDSMAEPSAHLNYAFDGRFDIFAHHIARGLTHDDVRTLYFGVLVHNPSETPVTLTVSQAVSYLSQEAPFNRLPSYVANPLGTVFSGPGSRVMGDVLRGISQPHWPRTVTIPPRHSHLLMNVPIPLRRLSVAVDGTLPSGSVIRPPLPQPEEEEILASASVDDSVMPAQPDRPLPTNGRSALMRLYSSGPVYVASLAMHAPRTADNHERVPTIREWARVLTQKGLAGPRDLPPTPPDAERFSRFFYGRVAGVAQGSQWISTLTDSPEAEQLTIPSPGRQISYALSTLDRNTFGTNQIQSGPIVRRYPDTAYRAHGNYGVHYNLSLPLYNNTDSLQRVAIKLETPIQNENRPGTLTFLDPPDDRIFFRGTVLVRYVDSWNLPQARYFHVIHRRGQQGKPLVTLRLPPGDRRSVKVEFLYPPDATPPQVLTVETLESTLR